MLPDRRKPSHRACRSLKLPIGEIDTSVSEPGDDRKRRAGVSGRLGDLARAFGLIDMAVDHDHLAVKVGECSEAKISMLQDRLDAHLTVVNAGHQGRRR